MSVEYKAITRDGLWSKNPAVVQILGLCPLLAVSNNVVNALGLAVATTLVLMGSNISVSLIRNYTPNEVRLPAFVMIIASLTTAIELLMQAYAYELYTILGIFIPLITTNCIVLGRADAFASKNPILPSALDGLMMGLGFGITLVMLGGVREVLANGTLFDQMDLLLGPMASNMTVYLIDDYPGFLLAALPPGAFIGLGLIIALRNIIDLRIKEREKQRRIESGELKSRRVRTTGHIA